MRITRALISVSNKNGIIELARFLHKNGIEIIATTGTARLLRDHDITTTDVEEISGNPEAFGGRMKTLSFQIESALLFKRDNQDDVNTAKKLGIIGIDLVVCNLYPFAEIAKQDTDHDNLIENIDIGGVTMIRSGAKNYKNVIVLTDPSQYAEFCVAYASGKLDTQKSMQYALNAFQITSQYDQFIYNHLHPSNDFHDLAFAFHEVDTIRYGENPHQKAWLAKYSNPKGGIANAVKVQGKKLSYNNLLDADIAWKCTSELHLATPHRFITTIVKHANPCGSCVSDQALHSLEQAWNCDPISSFGSIISCNQTVDTNIANWLKDKFVEIIVAPSFTEEATAIFRNKKKLRLLTQDNKGAAVKEKIIRSISGGVLIQEEDKFNYENLDPVTKTPFPKDYIDLAYFGIIVNKYLLSNSISLVIKYRDDFVLAGAGMGQPNRLDALKMLAGPRSQKRGHNMNEVVLISDAFFPFTDSIEVAHDLGIRYIIQPGGSIKDKEVIAACDSRNISMCFTKVRHFRH